MKRALVLSGGGAKGSYQYGVWKALKKLNIKFDIVTGTSIGAVNGAMMVLDNFKETGELWEKLTTKDIFYLDYDLRTKEGKKNFYVNVAKSFISDGGIDTTKMEEIFRKYIDEDKLRKSDIDYGIVTYSFTKKKPALLVKKDIPDGKLIDYIVASATCFPVVKPKQIGDEIFLDGGYYDNMPIDLAVKMGANEIIAVDLKAIGIKKKNDTKIPVKIIQPSSDMGSFLSFTRKEALYRIALGYNDTLKAFGKLDGDKYSFYKGQLNYNFLRLKDNYINNFKTYFVNKNDNLKKIFDSAFLEGLRSKLSSDDNIKSVFNDNIEEIGKIYDIDMTKIYLISRFYDIMFDKILKSDSKDNQSIVNFLYHFLIGSDNNTLSSLLLQNPKDFLLSFYILTVYQKSNIIKRLMFKGALKKKVEHGNN